MAGTIQEDVSVHEFQMLRSILFNQGLPRELYMAPSAVLVVSRDLELRGFISYRNGSYKLTREGYKRIQSLAGSDRVQMIDLPEEKVLDPSVTSVPYRVSSSLARQLAERVSSSEAV